MIQASILNSTINSVELVKGYPTGSKFQLMIEGSPSPLFDVKDTAENVRKILIFISFLFNELCPYLTKTVDQDFDWKYIRNTVS